MIQALLFGAAAIVGAVGFFVAREKKRTKLPQDDFDATSFHILEYWLVEGDTIPRQGDSVGLLVRGAGDLPFYGTFLGDGAVGSEMSYVQVQNSKGEPKTLLLPNGMFAPESAFARGLVKVIG